MNPRINVQTLAMIVILVAPAIANAGAPGDADRGTAGPPAPLGAEQLRAIDEKGVPAARLSSPDALPTHVVNGKIVPVVPAPAATAARVTSPDEIAARFAAKARRLPTISPALGAVPRPEWSLPGAPRKRPDAAVVGTKRVLLATPVAGAPSNETGGSPR